MYEGSGRPGKGKAWVEADLSGRWEAGRPQEENPFEPVYPSVRDRCRETRRLIASCRHCHKWCYIEHTDRDASNIWAGRRVRYFDEEGRELDRWADCSEHSRYLEDWCMSCMKYTLDWLRNEENRTTGPAQSNASRTNHGHRRWHQKKPNNLPTFHGRVVATPHTVAGSLQMQCQCRMWTRLQTKL